MNTQECTARRQAIAAEYQQGASVKALKARYPVSNREIRRALAEAGVPRRSPAERMRLFRKNATRPLDVAALADGYARGLSCRELGDQVGVSHQTVLNRLRAHGILTRREAARRDRAKKGNPPNPVFDGGPPAVVGSRRDE